METNLFSKINEANLFNPVVCAYNVTKIISKAKVSQTIVNMLVYYNIEFWMSEGALNCKMPDLGLLKISLDGVFFLFLAPAGSFNPSRPHTYPFPKPVGKSLKNTPLIIKNHTLI